MCSCSGITERLQLNHEIGERTQLRVCAGIRAVVLSPDHSVDSRSLLGLRASGPDDVLKALRKRAKRGDLALGIVCAHGSPASALVLCARCQRSLGGVMFNGPGLIGSTDPRVVALADGIELAFSRERSRG